MFCNVFACLVLISSAVNSWYPSTTSSLLLVVTLAVFNLPTTASTKPTLSAIKPLFSPKSLEFFVIKACTSSLFFRSISFKYSSFTLSCPNNFSSVSSCSLISFSYFLLISTKLTTKAIVSNIIKIKFIYDNIYYK